MARYRSTVASKTWRPLALFLSVALIVRSSKAFAPLNHHGRASLSATNSIGSLSTKDAPDVKVEDGTKELSYSAILKVIDERHYKESVESCPYLPAENVSQEVVDQSEVSAPSIFQSPLIPALPADTVNALRSAAQRFFNAESAETLGQKVANLEHVLSSFPSDQSDTESKLKTELGEALLQRIYPLVRSAWSNDDAFTFKNDVGVKLDGVENYDVVNESVDPLQMPQLCVASATIFAGGGYSGAKVAMTTLERDAGLFVVHIDLGNDQQGTQVAGDTSSTCENSVKGAIYLESLVQESSRITDSIVGPLNPGQIVVHKSEERTAAIIAPSNLRDLDDETQSLDSLLRRQLLKTAESTRHYALRLVLTTRRSPKEGKKHASPDVELSYPQAPPAERAYRLRSFARVRDDKVRYLTLAGLIDTDDHETHLWLGFDYLSRIDNLDYQVDTKQRLSDVNKAVFHLERAAALSPNDPRVYFQLATALGAKMECEKTLSLEGGNMVGASDSESLDQLAHLVGILEKSAILESAAVKLGINGIQDLTSCLNAVAETRCKMGDFRNALNVIDQWAECGSIRSALATEDMSISTKKETPHYEWISSEETGRKVAVKTVGEIPVFDDDDIQILVSAADRRFAQANGKQLSRYTMQYVGNSEVHLDDLCANDPVLKERIDHILRNKVYPLIRAAFSEDHENGAETPAGSLCVYDSIFVRYNGDEAKLAGLPGASQPLHQDGGIYSVNIALNSHKDDSENGFTGGGTFFEGLTDDEKISCIQRPVSPGHAILHHTTARHAGAPTTGGIRDILVIFLTARHPQDRSKSENTYRIERPMRLQTIAKQLPREKLIPCLELARENDPTNSEMSYWLGVHLLQGDPSDESDDRWKEICRGVENLECATKLSPTDARAHYHLGMAISTRHKYAMRTRRAHLLPPAGDAAASLIAAFESAIRLEKKCERAGCKNGINLAAAYLSLGDFMARLKNYSKALEYLCHVESAIRATGDFEESWAASMLEEVSAMTDFCRAELRNKEDPSLVT